MNRHAARRHPVRPGCERLESRQLLSGLGAVWIGQDGQDFVGPSPTPGPDGVQDVHIALSGLAAGRTVSFLSLTGYGGGAFQYQGTGSAWAAAFVRSSATGGDLYFNPYMVETGRQFEVFVRYDDGTTDDVMFSGGTADPHLHLIQANLRVTWLGQDGRDDTGTTAAVGPDGVQDAHLVLGNLNPGLSIASALIEGPLGLTWRYGTNKEGSDNAELIRSSSDPTVADLYLSPDRDLNNLTLTVQVVYSNGQIDSGLVTAGSTNPTLSDPAPSAPPVRIAGVSASWLGQDGSPLLGPGDVHLRAFGIPTSKTLSAAVLSDGAGVSWFWKANPAVTLTTDPDARPLALSRSGSQADLGFTPVRSENDVPLTLRLVFDDGTIALTTIQGGTVDLGAIAAKPADTVFQAHPGDDLGSLVNQYGTIQLAPGDYVLTRPLVLDQAVTITADPGATLIFSQSSTDAAWTAAIKIHAGNTTLNGFAVRFAGPVRWDWGVSFGPAVIGTTDDRDGNVGGVKANLSFTNLDIQTPPPSSTNWERTPALLRLMSADSGRIADNVLVGGMIEFSGGPWTITGNDYRGTLAGTFTDAVFAGHDTHDLVLTENHAEPSDGSGKTWRFLVLTSSGDHDLIARNTVVGIGPRTDDTIPWANASEVILTESYRIKFEGTPLSVSSDGLIVQVPPPQGGPVESGDGLAILSGPNAGQWRRIVQVLDSQTYLLDAPLPSGPYAISIARGFVDQTYQDNTIDSRDSMGATNFVLVGNHFGLTLRDNVSIGGQSPLRLQALATESPRFWGWTHSPMVGVVLDENTFAGGSTPAVIGIEHSQYTKSNQGRVYLAASLTNNIFDISGSSPALVLGDASSIDPGELRVTFTNNRSTVPGASVLVPAAVVNDVALVDGQLALTQTTPRPAAPTNLRLVSDTGSSATDGITSEARLQFDPVSGASGYEYQVGGGPFRPLGAATTFTPVGLSQGSNTVMVRALSGAGDQSPAVSITFTYDTQIPQAVSGLTALAGNQVVFTSNGSDYRFEYRVGGGPFIDIGTATQFTPDGLASGTNVVGVRAVDLAGNVGPESRVVVNVVPALSGVWLAQDGKDYVGKSTATKADGFQDIHIQLTNVMKTKAIRQVSITGDGGGAWSSTGAGGRWRIYVVRRSGTTVADLYFAAYQLETGRNFHIEVTYTDGTTAVLDLSGGKADPNLRTGRVTAASRAPVLPRSVSGFWFRG